MRPSEKKGIFDKNVFYIFVEISTTAETVSGSTYAHYSRVLSPVKLHRFTVIFKMNIKIARFLRQQSVNDVLRETLKGDGDCSSKIR